VTAPVRVLVADDHPPTRVGVRLALAEHGFTICAEAADARGAVAGALREAPDVCLLDIRMPGGGIAAAAEIAARLPETVIVMLTVSRDDTDLFDALRAGASGYLLKDIDPDRLPVALRGVMAGEVALPRQLVSRLVEEFEGRSRRRFRVAGLGDRPSLTEREWEVLELLHDGLTTREIAERLSISAVTVRRHASAIVRKLRVRNRGEALRLLERARSDE
jgi:DNA-binding NarL/FixJ family response regulator